MPAPSGITPRENWDQYQVLVTALAVPGFFGVRLLEQFQLQKHVVVQALSLAALVPPVVALVQPVAVQALSLAAACSALCRSNSVRCLSSCVCSLGVGIHSLLRS